MQHMSTYDLSSTCILNIFRIWHLALIRLAPFCHLTTWAIEGFGALRSPFAFDYSAYTVFLKQVTQQQVNFELTTSHSTHTFERRNCHLSQGSLASQTLTLKTAMNPVKLI